MDTVRLVYTPGATPHAVMKPLGQAGGDTIALTEIDSGYFIGTIPPNLAAGYYDLIYLEGTTPIGSEVILWDGEGIVEALALLTTAPVTVNVVSPLAADGGIKLVRGDSYLAADGRALSMTFAGIPSLAGAVVMLNIQDAYTDLVTTITGTVTGTDAVRFELTSAQTAAMVPGTLRYDVQATLANGHVITPALGVVEVVGDVR